jgi:ATP-dependent DNA helicase DinG
MNHTLFSELCRAGRRMKRTTSGYLFGNDFVIFDEAHTVEGIAARQLGMAVSQYGLKQALQRLYNPKTKKACFRFCVSPMLCVTSQAC